MEYCVQDYLLKLKFISLDDFYCCICCKRGSKSGEANQYCSKKNKNRNSIYCICLIMGVHCRRCRAMEIKSCGNQDAPKETPHRAPKETRNVVILSDTDESALMEQSNEDEILESIEEIESIKDEPESGSEQEPHPVSSQSESVLFLFRFYII